MPKPKNKALYPGLSPKMVRHVTNQLKRLDWQALQRIAAECCQDCPGKADPDGPPCERCPLRPITLELGITAARARSAQHTREFLESLPVENSVENPDTF